MRQTLTAIACSAIIAAGFATGQASSSTSPDAARLKSIDRHLATIESELKMSDLGAAYWLRQICRNTTQTVELCP